MTESWDGPDGSGAVLDTGRATLELLSAAQAELVDRVEVGSRVAGPVQVALEVADSAGTAAGSSPAAPRRSPSRSSPHGATATSGSHPRRHTLTLFTVLEEPG